MKTSNELRAERATEINEARSALAAAEARDGGATAEDLAAFDKAMDGADQLEARAVRLERSEKAEASLSAPAEERSGRPLAGSDGAETADTPAQRAALKADFRRFLATGEVRGAYAAEQRKAVEYRDTIIGTDGKGGYLIAPKVVSDSVVKQVDDLVFVRSLATITKVKEAKKLGIRKLTTRMADANWTTEIEAVTEDTTMAFGIRDLEPYQLTKLAKISLRTLALSVDSEPLVMGELAYKFAISEEKGFYTGDGSGKPLGVYTASSSGISTARDVVAGTATALTADGLIDVKYSLKGGYLADPSVRWSFHRDGVKQIRKLKNSGDGQYVWAAGLAGGQPDRLLDIPIMTSEYNPNTFTAGLYVGILGAFRYYHIAEVDVMFLQRLVELYAATGEVGFIGRRWVDGAPVLEDAFARAKLAAS